MASQNFNIFDKTIRYFSPELAVRRAQARMALSILDKTRRFDGASKSSRFSQWRRPGTSANAALDLSLPALRNGSRDLTRNNPWAEKALTVIESNTVGTGIIGQIVHTTDDKRREKEIRDLWNSWANTKAIDAEDRRDLRTLENNIIRCIAESGEILIRRRYRRGNAGYPIPIQIQLLEPDHLDSSRDGILDNKNEVRNGIEYDKQDKRVAYWLYPTHPGENKIYNLNYKSVRVPARDIIHAFDPKRCGQNRGYPWASPAIRRMKDFDDYEDAQLVRQKIAACFAAFIHDMDTSAAGGTGLDENPPSDNQLEYIQPGIMEHLPAGKDIKFASPPAVQNYGEYTTNVLRGVAAAYGITYEALTGDYSKLNFSSGRMGWIEMSRNIDRWQHSIMKVQVLSEIEKWFIGGAQLAGYNTDGISIKWMMPRREMIDPTKEVPAMGKAVRLGLTSLPRVLASMGLDHEEVMNEIEKSNEALDKKGIILDSDPRKVNTAGSENANFSEETN